MDPHSFNINSQVVPYVYQEFPRILHRPGGLTLVVANGAEKDVALIAGWQLTPSDVHEATKGEADSAVSSADVAAPTARTAAPKPKR